MTWACCDNKLHLSSKNVTRMRLETPTTLLREKRIQLLAVVFVTVLPLAFLSGKNIKTHFVGPREEQTSQLTS